MAEFNVRGTGAENQAQRLELQNVETIRQNSANVTEPAANALRFETAVNDLNFTAQTTKFRLNETLNAQPQYFTGQEQEVNDAAQRVWDAAGNDPATGSAALATEIENLRAKYGDEAVADLINKLHQDSQSGDTRFTLNDLMSFSGDLTDAQKNSIGQAVGQAYDAMTPEAQAAFVKDLGWQIANDAFRGNGTNVADIISRSSSDKFKQDSVAVIAKHATDEVSDGWSLGPWDFNNGGSDINALYDSAAMIANSGSTGAAQTQMFGSITDSFENLTDAQMRILEGNPGFKDAMSELFINNSTDILHSLTGRNGRFDNDPAVDGFRRFLETTLFSSNPGAKREELMGALTKTLSDFADPNAPATAGRTKEADATLAGGLLALTQAAALFQKDDINASRESREEAVKFFTGMAFAFVPGASDALGEASGTLMDFAYDQAKDWATENVDSTLANFINDFSDGAALENISNGYEALRGMHFAISGGTLQDYPELAAAFDSGYASIGVDQLFQKAME